MIQNNLGFAEHEPECLCFCYRQTGTLCRAPQKGERAAGSRWAPKLPLSKTDGHI